MARESFAQVAAPLDVSLTAGDDWGMQLTFTSGGSAMNLTGYTFAAAVYRNGSSVQAITVTETNLASGVIDVSLTDTQTAALTLSNYWWSLTYTNGSDSFTPVGGKFILKTKGKAA